MPRFDISKVKSKGRPKGSKNQVYLTLNYWYNELMKDWKKLRPSQRAKFSVQLMQMLTNKMKTMPGTPEQSVLNTEDAAKMLAELSGAKADSEQTLTSDDVVSPTTSDPLNQLKA